MDRKYKSFLSKRKRVSSATIERYCIYVSLFIKWIEGINLSIQEINYNDAHRYRSVLIATGNTPNYLNQQLCAIRYYFDYLLVEGKRKGSNPAKNVKVEGTIRKKKYDTFTSEELASIYELYQPQSLAEKRNKVMAGLFLFQGVTSEDIALLKLENLKLEKGTIYIPKTKATESRTLKLEPFQILAFLEYVNFVRLELLEQTKQSTNRLFISAGGGKSLRQVLINVVRAISKIEPRVKGVKQIRASVIGNWLLVKEILEVKVLAGHKYVSSTERYFLDNKKLRQELEMHHPFK